MNQNKNLIRSTLKSISLQEYYQEAKQISSNAGYQTVNSTITTSPSTYGAAKHVLNRFTSGHQTSSELLAQVINAFAVHARIPHQLIMVIPAHGMLADFGVTMYLLLDLMFRLTGLFSSTVVNLTASVLLRLLFVPW
jgi:hypothetical protein